MAGGPTEAGAAPPLGSTELDVLLELLGRQRFLIHQFSPDHNGPTLLAATRNLGGVEDVVLLVDPEHAAAWRCPAGTDPFAPSEVFWSYAGCPVWTLRAMLTLAPLGHPDAPTTLTPAPAGLGLPAEGRLPVWVRKRGWY